STNLSVLLLEAGDASQYELGGKDLISFDGKEMPYTPFDVPYYWSDVSLMPQYHWNVSNVFVAKALGGCGIHNAMLYVRALPSDIDSWQLGPTWTWDIALNIYLSIESYIGSIVPYHGYNGTVQTSKKKLFFGAKMIELATLTEIDSLSNQFLAACIQKGIPLTNDFNAPDKRIGAGVYNFNIRNGIRESAAKVFLSPLLTNGVSKHPRFTLLLNTTAENIQLDNGNAKGAVVINARGEREFIRASRAVVVTAGAIHTPKLLTLSGIAAKDILNDLDIPIQVDSPLVGKNLQDHPAIAMNFKASHPLTMNISHAWEDYLSSRRGWLSTTGLSTGAFFATPGSTIPDLQLTFFPRKSEPQWASNASEQEILFTIALLNPEARNRVVVKSKVAHEPCEVMPEIPEATSEHLSDMDAHKLLYGIEIVRELVKAAALAPLLGDELMPGGNLQSKKVLLNWIHFNVYRNSHWVGSAKMGSDPSTSVVSPSLLVWNTSNLFVADASVIPNIPNGNVHSTVVMVASHASKLIASMISY
ncbi:choline dehydrogenase, partial [Thraustotheca clavata]